MREQEIKQTTLEDDSQLVDMLVDSKKVRVVYDVSYRSYHNKQVSMDDWMKVRTRYVSVVSNELIKIKELRELLSKALHVECDVRVENVQDIAENVVIESTIARKITNGQFSELGVRALGGSR